MRVETEELYCQVAKHAFLISYFSNKNQALYKNSLGSFIYYNFISSYYFRYEL